MNNSYKVHVRSGLYEYVIYLKGLSHEMYLAFDDMQGEYIKMASMSLETIHKNGINVP
jgi:hypothetical protein